MIQGRTRLHITPLTPDLFRAIVPASAVDLVKNLSYHAVQTFPDSGYGYLDLPSMEADKLKKKLNGAILRGKKIKIDEARPPKRRRGEDESDRPEAVAAEATVETTSRRSKRSKKDPAVISGFELPASRKVKRGWTEVKEDRTKRSKKGKSRRLPSKYSEKEELLFRTKLPQNKKDPVKEEKKRKSGHLRNSNGDVVHEFEKSAIQPSFLRNTATSAASKPAVKYVDGKGWVDEDGKVVEEEPTTAKLLKASRGERTQQSSEAEDSLRDDSTSSSNDTPKPASKASGAVSRLTEEAEDVDETSSAGSSSVASSEATEESDSNASGVSSGARDRDQSPNPETSIHPLEALFKKPSNPASRDIAKPSLELQTSFAFFDPSTQDDLDEDSQPAMPETPYSSQDVRSRGHRSAAPTPDTAHPSRYNSYTSQLTASDEEEEEEPETPNRRSQRNHATPSKSSQREVSQEQSAFEKQFWENRGELGRGWKRRRREVQKEKRQQENRAMRRPDW